MDSLAFGLVALSTVMHAVWNLLARGDTAAAYFRGMLLLGSALGFLPMLAWGLLAGLDWPARTWPYLGASGVCCGLYYYCLARAYAAADFTLVYPLARAIPVLLMAVADVLRGRALSPLGWVGVGAVALGCALVPLRSLRGVAWGQYLNRSMLWMALTALCTVGYTLLDKLAAEGLPPGPASAARYGYFFFAISTAVFWPLDRFTRRPSPLSRAPGWLVALLGAVLNFASYWLVLWAYQLTPNASYVLAFRQLSIVLGVFAAVVWFHERAGALRLGGALLIGAGLLLLKGAAGA